MKLNLELLNKIEQKVGSPFYVAYPNIFEENITAIHGAFKKQYDNIILGYSYKTNYLPEFCKIIKDNGGYAEVVSRMEYDLALKLGYKGEKIIFNGPLKRKEDIYKAFTNKSIVNLDALYEIDYLESFLKDYPDLKPNIKLGIRLNIVLKNTSGSSAIQEGIKVGRFGFSNYDKDLDEAISRIHDLGIDIISVHGHASSNNRKVENYITIVNEISSVIENYNLSKIRFVDVGGGFLGPIPKYWNFDYQPTFDDYANQVITTLKTKDWFNKKQPFVIIEPGVSVVANAISFVSKIYSLKKHDGANFLLVDGSIYNVKPTFHSLNMPHYLIRKVETYKEESKIEKYDVVGSTCMEKDIILKDVELKDVSKDDFIVFDNIGAYTIVMTPPFINLYPAIVSVKKNNFKVVREPQTTDDFLINYDI